MADNHNKFQNDEIRSSLSEDQANEAMSLKTWWAIPFVQPISRKLVVYIVNHTSITANQITSLGIIFRLVTMGCFLTHSYSLAVVGALSYYLAYVCDCADGTVARIKQQSSELGRYLDHMSDLIGDILILLSLAWSQGVFFTYWIWAMVFMHIAECYISYLTGFVVKQHKGTLGNFPIFHYFNIYRQWWFQRNTKSFFSFPDYNALVFVLFPLLGRPSQGLEIGFYVLIFIVFYTIFSTFVSIHTDEKQFP